MLLRFLSIPVTFLILTSATYSQENSQLVQSKDSADSLPQPFATKSAMKFSDVIGWPKDKSPIALAGFTVTRYAEGLDNPRWIYVLPNGDILIAETKKPESTVEKIGAKVIGASTTHGVSPVANRIRIFRDTNKDGKPDINNIFLDNLKMPFGMVVINDKFYVANTDAILMFDYKSGETTITGTGKKIADLPAEGRHWTRNLIASRDGKKIYVAVGSSSNVAENGIEKEKNRACILEMNPDGSDMKVYAGGLRNPVGMDWMPNTNTLWTAVNERDELGDDLPPDYVTSVKEGGFYGWPYSYEGSHPDPRFKDKEQRMDLVKIAIKGDVAVGAHTASLGLAFNTKDKFPKEYSEAAFVGQHGSWNRSVFSGYKVIYITFNNGKAGTPKDFLTGFIANESEKQVYGRPVGVAFTPEGDLLVADDAGGIIWMIIPAK